FFGFAGKDSFNISGPNNKLIKLRVVDTESKGKIYKRNTFKYDILHPSPSFGYNRDDGVQLGATLSYTEHSYNKDPYRVFHQVKALYAFRTNAFRIQYDFVATDVIGSSDLVVRADLRAPNNTINFFGAGNNSENNIKEGTDYRYYQTTVFHGDFGMFLKKEIAPDIHLFYGPTFQVYNLDSSKNRNRLVYNPELIGMDTTNLYHKRTYAGIGTALVIDNRNDANYPTRGVKWKTAFLYNKGLNRYTSEFSQFTSDLSVYISSNIPSRMVVALRFGGGINFGSYQFYQSQFLSGTQNLRGFRKYRFAGEKMFYNNLDVRIRLKDYQGYLYTGSYGILLFNDIGRVWLDGEESGRWHDGYGFGAWIFPAHRFMLTGTIGFSKEGALGVVNLGFMF
ncbi:MAG: BamA/TamA family outer membrane protein, partial [Chitinophagaceae bacterium]|nr:BamA/TamA family outer membrane protein [Chitinophagaceae bacterium]